MGHDSLKASTREKRGIVHALQQGMKTVEVRTMHGHRYHLLEHWL